MIKEGKGNLLAAEVDALVNTVDTVGIMGKGVALQFKQAFPDNFKAYAKACREDEVRLGRMFTTHTGMLTPRLIINFPTKAHWKSNSRLKDIELGMDDLIKVVIENGVNSIALPPLGCGFGGLRWSEVKPIIVRAFANIPDVEVLLYSPNQAIAPEERIVAGEKPKLTRWRAALIRIVDFYGQLGFDATHIEAQKLIYFLSRGGLELRTKFIPYTFGPYDANMTQALKSIDGHYLVGFGDGELFAPVQLASGAIDAANRYVREQGDEDGYRSSIEKVERLIEGFESPYGLELLATVHMAVSELGATSEDEAVKMSKWNDRKRRVLSDDHLRLAYQTLQAQGWLTESTA